jgi:Tfp pilus assembly protein PilV
MRQAPHTIARFPRRGFTLLELQIAVLLLAFAVMTLASLMTTQQRVLKHLRGAFTQSATVYVTRSKDPWVKKLLTPARITAAEFTPTTPAAVDVANTVTIIERQVDLKTESITVTADAVSIE